MNYDGNLSRDTSEFNIANKQIKICFDPHSSILIITDSTDKKGITFDLNKSIDSLTKQYQFENKRFSTAVLTLDGIIRKTKYRLLITSIIIDKVKNKTVINNLGGRLLIGKTSED